MIDRTMSRGSRRRWNGRRGVKERRSKFSVVVCIAGAAAVLVARVVVLGAAAPVARPAAAPPLPARGSYDALLKVQQAALAGSGATPSVNAVDADELVDNLAVAAEEEGGGRPASPCSDKRRLLGVELAEEWVDALSARRRRTLRVHLARRKEVADGARGRGSS